MNTAIVVYHTRAQYDVFKELFREDLDGVTVVPADPDSRLFRHITVNTVLVFLPGWRQNRNVPDVVWAVRAYASGIKSLNVTEEQFNGEAVCWPD